MKIQFLGEQTFRIEGKKSVTVYNPKTTKASDVALFNKPSHEAPELEGAKKALSLPGEYEVAGALITGIFTDQQSNVAFKVDLDEIVCAHVGTLKELPNSKFYDELGENVDVLFLPLNENIKGKQAREIIENISPRMAFLAGDTSFFPEAREVTGAKLLEESEIKIARAQFSDDVSEIFILSVA